MFLGHLSAFVKKLLNMISSINYLYENEKSIIILNVCYILLWFNWVFRSDFL